MGAAAGAAGAAGTHESSSVPKSQRLWVGGIVLFLTVEDFFCLAAGKRCPGGVRGLDDLSPTLPWCPEGQPRWESQVAKRLLRLRNPNSLLARGPLLPCSCKGPKLCPVSCC